MDEGDKTRVRETVQAAIEEHHLPGISVGVVEGDELVFAEGFGLADIESGRPQEPGLRQRIGSITKTMVGLCAMALVEEGRLSLEDRVVDLLPEMTFEGPSDAITLWHLLTHTSGIGEMPTPEDIRDPEGALWIPEDGQWPGIPDAYPRGITIEVAPGTKWAYANHGWMLVGEIVSREERAPIEDVLRRRIFEPLGMADTDCLDDPQPDLTTGYHRPVSEDQRELMERVGIPVPPEDEPVDGWNIRGKYMRLGGRAAGAVQSTIPDMARYASALLKRGSGIVKAGMFEKMVSPQWCPDDRLQSIGIAFFRSPRFGGATLEHGGGVTGGWNTMLTIVPDENLAVLVHMNLAYEDFDFVEGRILRAVLDAPKPSLPDTPLDQRLREAAPGVYEAEPGALTNYRIAAQMGRLQISASDGGLVLHARRGRWKRGVRMVPADPRDPGFFVLDTGDLEPPCIALELDGGFVRGLRCDRLISMVRNDAVAPWA